MEEVDDNLNSKRVLYRCGRGPSPTHMFVSSEKFIEAHSGKVGDISVYSQESN